MNRYKPTMEERAWLLAEGWDVDDDGWWWNGDNLLGLTYREAVRENAARLRRERADQSKAAED